MFQLAFATTSATIVSGILAERVKLLGYAAISAWSLLVYCVVANWVWNDLYLGHSPGWLSAIRMDADNSAEVVGFYDFAGSTVVHSVGAWIGLVITILIGPRVGRFENSAESGPIDPYNLGLAVLGVFILILGWWGFNGGSTLKYTYDIGAIVFNTLIAGASGGAVAYMLTLVVPRWKEKRRGRESRSADALQHHTFSVIVGGTLGGLVAITASANGVSALGAIAIGAAAGLVHNLALDLLEELRIDDPVGGIPVHGACGVLGTLCVAFSDHADGLWFASLTKQFLGVMIVFIFVVGSTSLVFFWFRGALRVGIDLEVGRGDSSGVRVIPEISWISTREFVKHNPALVLVAMFLVLIGLLVLLQVAIAPWLSWQLIGFLLLLALICVVVWIIARIWGWEERVVNISGLVALFVALLTLILEFRDP